MKLSSFRINIWYAIGMAFIFWTLAAAINIYHFFMIFHVEEKPDVPAAVAQQSKIELVTQFGAALQEAQGGQIIRSLESPAQATDHGVPYQNAEARMLVQEFVTRAELREPVEELKKVMGGQASDDLIALLLGDREVVQAANVTFQENPTKSFSELKFALQRLENFPDRVKEMKQLFEVIRSLVSSSAELRTTENLQFLENIESHLNSVL